MSVQLESRGRFAFELLVALLIILQRAAFSQTSSTISIDSTAPPRYGFLKVISNLDRVYLVVDTDFAHAKQITRTDVIRLPAGEHSFVIAHHKMFDSKFTLRIVPDSIVERKIHLDTSASSTAVMQHSSYPRILWDANILVLTDDDSQVFFDSTFVGTGRAKSVLLPGAHVINTEHPFAGTRQQKVTLTADRLNVVELYNKPERTLYWALSLVPGGSRIYANRSSKGYLLFSACFGSLVGSLLSHVAFKKDNADYQDFVSQYNRATVETDVARLGNEAQSKLDDARKYARIRDGALIGAAIVWALSFIDVVGGPEGGYRQPKSFDALSLAAVTSLELNVALSIKIPLGN